jgi:outer membrane protein assembly factor BamB
MQQRRKFSLDRLVLPGIILAGCSIFLFWLLYNPVREFTEMVPGLDNRPSRSSSASDSIIIGEHFTRFDSTFSTSLNGKWPNFRGSEYDNVNKENIRLIDKVPTDGSRILWEKELGEGHAAAAIYNGRVYVLDYDERRERDILHCYALVDGKELWRRGYNVKIKRNHGMSRTIPAVNDKYVVTMGPRCQVMCSDAITGDLIWGMDLVRDFKAVEPLWYTGQCPIIDNNIAVLAVGGKVLMMGVDCATGKVLWQTPNPDSLKMSHSSVVPMTLAGRKMYVYNALGGLCGISAEETDRGRLLWKTKDFEKSVIAPSPVFVGQNRVFVTAGYSAGSALFNVNGDGINFSVNTLQVYKPSEGMSSEQQTPIYKDGYVFNIQTKDAGPTRNQFICCAPENFKNILWTSAASDRFGMGPYIVADGKFYILNDEGEMTIARFSTSKFEVLDKAKIIDGNDAWGPLALADGLVILRDSKKMFCMDLRANQSPL